MESIDNILGKVDTMMKKTDSFLEEHLPEEPPIDYEKEGVTSFQVATLIIMENVKFHPYLEADYVKYMLKRSKNGFLSIFFDRNIPSYEKNE